MGKVVPFASKPRKRVARGPRRLIPYVRVAWWLEGEIARTSPLTLQLPIRLVSEANRASSQHWRVRWRRGKEQKALVSYHRHVISGRALPLTCTLTRFAPRLLDDDNLVSSFKAVRDEIANCLGLNDRDPAVTWKYAQKKNPEYGCLICLTPERL